MNLIDQQEQTTFEQWRAVVAASAEPLVETGVRRREPRRSPTLISAKLTYRPNKKDSPTERSCTLLDVSAHGMLVRSRYSIAPETPVEIEAFWGEETSSLRGTVEHCTPTVGAFKVGIRLHFASAGSEDPHDEATTIERCDEVENHSSECDGSYEEAPIAEHEQGSKKTSASRISRSHAIIGCLMFLATLAFVLLSGKTPLTALAWPSEHETEPLVSANLEFYHNGHAWNKAAYSQKAAFCERLAESLPNLGHDGNYYCRFLNKVFHAADKRVLKCTLSEAIIIGLSAD